MTCSICQQSGHNKRTCPAEIKMKLACADCGQVETECGLTLVGEKVMCYDCLYIENHPDATCHRCETKLYSKTLVLCGGGGGECETWYCANCHADGTHDCPVCDHEDEDDETETDDDETVSVVSEDTCECCGKPYDPRNPHRLWELCDCVQNDDGTLSRPEEVPELPCPDCRRWFDEGKERCKSCDYKFDGEEEDQDDFTNRICEWCHLDFDLADPHYYDEEGNCCYCSEECFKKEQDWLSAPSSTRPAHGSIRTSPTRDQLIALGKYKLAKFQIGKQDASGNAL